MDTKPSNGKRWWGAFTVPEGEGRFWQIGPLRLWIHHDIKEWRVAYDRGHDPLAEALTIAEVVPGEAIAEETSLSCFAFQEPSSVLRLSPAPADRAIIVNPVTPFILPPGQEVTLFVSCPLWLRIEVGDPPVRLQEEPIYRPSDTWFGPSTMEGELCYASRMGARLDLRKLPVRPQRSVTAVRIRNRAKTQLPLERLRFPMPNLSLFATEDHRLWTEAATLVREEDGELASLRLDREPPPEAKGAALLTGPRVKAQRGLLVRSFGGLLSLGR